MRTDWKHKHSGPHILNGNGTRPQSAKSAEGFERVIRPTRSLRIAITGASSGIGAALTRELAHDGHIIFGCARRRERIHEIFRDLKSCHGWVCDISDEDAVREFARNIVTKTSELDALINSAGLFGSIGPIETPVAKNGSKRSRSTYLDRIW